MPEATKDDSSEGSDVAEDEQHPPAAEGPGSVLAEPAEPSPEVNRQPNGPEVQQPVSGNDVMNDVPGTDVKVLRDRRHLRRPARFVD